MTFLLFWLATMGAIGIVARMAVRDDVRRRAERLSLFDRCKSLFESVQSSADPSGFPRMSWRQNGRSLLAELIFDTMTIRRLPQLWLSVTLLAPMPGTSGFAILRRPSGNDYYSLTHRFSRRLEPPVGLPWEILARGADAPAQVLLDRLAHLLGDILADPRVKEIAVTDRGLRIICQNAQGRYGEHLLLRQAAFDHAEVEPETLQTLTAQLEALHHALQGALQKVAA